MRNFQFSIFNFQSHVRPRRGSALLLTILILGILLVAGVSLARVVIIELRATRDMEAGLVASAAAESGVEQGLYLLRKTTTPASGVGALPADWLTNGASVDRGVANAHDRYDVAQLVRDQSVEFDVYDTDNPLNPGPNQLELTWSGSGSEWVAIHWAGWDAAGQMSEITAERLLSHSQSSTTITLTDLCQHARDSDVCSAFSATGFRVSVTARYDDITNLSMRLQRDATSMPFPGEVRMRATGKFLTARSTVAVRFPRRSPVSGVLGPVVFSECEIIKGLPRAPDCP